MLPSPNLSVSAPTGAQQEEEEDNTEAIAKLIRSRFSIVFLISQYSLSPGSGCSVSFDLGEGRGRTNSPSPQRHAISFLFPLGYFTSDRMIYYPPNVRSPNGCTKPSYSILYALWERNRRQNPRLEHTKHTAPTAAIKFAHSQTVVQQSKNANSPTRNKCEWRIACKTHPKQMLQLITVVKINNSINHFHHPFSLVEHKPLCCLWRYCAR